MTKISQYSTDVNITGNDKWIGSDAQNFLITKNFTPNNLASYFNGNNVIDIGASIRYMYQTLLPGEAREQGTISFETEIGPQVNFSDITTFLIAKNTLKGNTVTQYLDFLVDSKVLLSRANNINIFGYYKITSIEPWIPNTNFFVVEVDFLAGNGFIYEDLDYLVSLVDKAQDTPTTVWGSITGDIEDQTDLIDYIASQIIAPTLVALPFTTDHISATGNQYVIGDVVWYLGNVYRCIANNDSLLPTNTLYWTNLGEGYPLVQQPADWNATSGNNQILNKPTIPTLTSQLTNDSGFLTQDNVVEYPDLASFPATGVIGTIYIALDTEDFYLWDGVTYVLTTPPDTGITGVGTTNTYPKFTSPTTIGNGRLVDGVNGGIYTFGSQWINLINGGSVLTLNRSQSSMNFELGVPNALPTTISSTQNREGLHITSIGDFVLKAGNPLGVVYNVNRANRNIHIGASTDTDYATQKLQVTGNLRVTGAVYDSNNSAGTSGQLLSSTATGTDWIDPPTGGVTSVGLTMPSAFTVTNSPITSSGDIAVTGAGLVSQYIDGTGALQTFPTIPSLTGYVPYTGATADVNLGTHKLLAKDLVINHPSGSGDAATIIKGGSGEALKVEKTSGSGNAASITGGVTLLEELHLTTDLADAYISSAATWNAKQDALGYTPYRFVNATQATYLGAVVGLVQTEVAQTTILGGTFNSSDLMKIFFKVTKSATTAGVNMRIRVNTTNDLATATQIGILTLGAASTYGLMNRNINLFGGNAYNYNFASTLASDILLTNTAGTSFTYNTANDLYVFFTIQFGNVLDSATFQFVNITN